MPRDPAFSILFDYMEGSLDESPWACDLPSRAAHFVLDSGRFANYECYGATYMIQFAERGRVFQVHVSFGDGATDETRANALAVLDSLEVAARS